MEDCIVTVEQGQLRGQKVQSCLGEFYYSFQGVPFAKPPLADLRFKAPQPPEKWDGIRDATSEGSECYANHVVFPHIVGSEDCLYLNVYTPEIKPDGPLKAVMVWIHGGGFTSGSGNSDMYGPDYLLTKGVVVVTINYRLGVLGFLSLEDTSLGVPGNAGLKDQVMALRWIQQNIRNFGGDPGNVTIFGESAGGASVHYLVLSPMARGLFHKAIAQSGSALNSWACGERTAVALAKALNFASTSEDEILKFLQGIPVEKLYEAQLAVKDSFRVDVKRPFGPIVERISPNEPAFLAEEPLDVILQGKYNKVPLMMGYTDQEGMLHDIIHEGKTVLIRDFEESVPYAWKLPKGSAKSKFAARKIKEFYYGNEEPSKDNKTLLFKLQTDNLFFREILASAKLHAEKSSAPVYFYRFSFDGECNLFKKFSKLNYPGACHADELAYLFKVVVTDRFNPETAEGIVSQTLVRLWTNFAKHGDPNSPGGEAVWKPVRAEEVNFLDINRVLTPGVNPEAESIAFWDDVYNLAVVAAKL